MTSKAFSEPKLETCPVTDNGEKSFNDWKRHLVEMSELGERVKGLERSINTIVHHTVMLNELSKLGQIADTLNSLDNKILSAALGRKHVPLSVVLVLSLAFLVTIIVQEIKNTGLGVQLTNDGIKIERHY